MSHCHNHYTYHSNAKIVRRNSLPWELGSYQTKITGCEPTIIASLATTNGMITQKDKASGTTNHVLLVVNSCSTKEYETTFLVEKESISCLDGYPHDKDEIWQMVNAKIKGTMPSKILEIKNNLPKPVNIILVLNPNVFFDIKTNPEDFHEHYQNLALTRKEQEEQLAQLNTRLYNHCLIPCDFQYCNECDLIYNPPIHMIYMIPEEKKPISSCTLKSESLFNSDSNSDNDDDKNTGSSSIQNSNNNNNDSNSDSNSNLKYKQYIAIPDLIRELELK
ncbi:hypothetical protein G9A89_020491 [Geosiphon pyriformis]|nr:hypothetical protein G9A89_020491 [Geosiphon pyriformis]